jgi:hypothetical protein
MVVLVYQKYWRGYLGKVFVVGDHQGVYGFKDEFLVFGKDINLSWNVVRRIF